ncbi:MAG: hypothetical protein ABIH04_06470 [Planctomycetota bacterium]
MRQRMILAFLCALLAVCATLRADDEDAARDRLVLDDGDILTGLIEKIDEDGTIYVKTQGSEKPLTVPITQLRHIYFNVHKNLPSEITKEAFVYTLIDGTRITGRVDKWADEKLTIFNEYGREIEFSLKNIRHISTSPAGSLYMPWNTGSEDILVLNDGRQIKCELLPLVPVKSESGRMIVEKVEYKAGEETKSISITEVNGLVFPRKPPPGDKKPKEGWYALVSMPNYDCLPGVIDSMEDGKLHLVTQYMGVVNIDRSLIRSITFSTSLSFYYGHTLICDQLSNRVVELDMQMNEVWSYGVTAPWHATRLQNGNILITGGNGVFEVDYQKQIVWKKEGLNYPSCAIRLKNGNTLIAERNSQRIIEVKPDGSVAGTYFDRQCYSQYIEELPNGNILICDQGRNLVFEGTRDGKNKIVRQWAFSNPQCARALPDGKIAVLEQGRRRIVIMSGDGKHLSTISDINHWMQRFAITGEGNILVPFHPENNPGIPPKLREYSPDGKLISEKAVLKKVYRISHIEQN